MIEVLKHILGICGEHWHPNIWTAAAASPLIATTTYWIKCKCGGIFNHKKSCNEREDY